MQNFLVPLCVLAAVRMQSQHHTPIEGSQSACNAFHHASGHGMQGCAALLTAALDF